MRKTIRIISWILGTLLTVFLVGLLCTYWWLSTKWADFYTEDEMTTMADQVNAAPTLPDKFYQAYDKIYPDQRDRTLSKMSIGVVWFVLTDNDEQLMTGKQCNCIFATNYLDSQVPMTYHSWTSYVTAHGLENYTTEEKCLDFYYSQFDLQDYSTKYFNKTFDELTVDENTELILRFHNLMYDKRPDLLAKKLKELKNK